MLPVFSRYRETFDPAVRSLEDNERALMRAVPPEGGVALVQRPRYGIAVPRSYLAKERFAGASAALAAEGCPVHLRLSGGGVVPQSAAVVNLYLAYAVSAPNPFPEAEAHYLALCGLLQRLFGRFGIATDAQTVEGSFCDGRFNLAAGGRKIAGTAQYWQRDPRGENRFVVLSNAVVVAEDAAGLTGQANRFERALGSGVRYLPEKTVSVRELSGAGSAEVAAELERLLGWRQPECLSENESGVFRQADVF